MTVGTVTGAGIFILIGPLGVSVGPGLFLTYLIALIVAAGSAVCYGQVAATIPMTAATYRYSKIFYGDALGFAMGWLRWVSACYALSLMALGFANYLGPTIGLENRLLAFGILLIFYIVNVLGLKTTKAVQSALVAAVIAGLLAFIGFGFPLIQWSKITQTFTAGTSSLLQGSAAAFFAYTGLYFVAEIGDEVKNPQKNVPLAIFLSALVLGLLYLAVALVFSWGLNWDQIRSLEPNLSQAASLLLSPQLAAIVQFSALVAVFTPINAIFTASSRLLSALAADGFMPAVLKERNRFGAPGAALTVNFIFGSIIIVFDFSFIFLGALNSLVSLVGMALIGGAALKLKERFPQETLQAPFLLSQRTLAFWASFTIFATIILSIVTFIEDVSIFYSLLFWLFIGGANYLLRKKLKSTPA